MMRKLSLILALLLGSTVAHAQVRQSGSVTPGHAAVWSTNSIIQDAGTASAPAGITSLGITQNANAGLCVNSANAPNPYNYLCLSATTSGGTKISSYTVGGATTPTLTLDLNGTLTTFPGFLDSLSTTTGSYLVRNATVWTGTTIQTSTCASTVTVAGVNQVVSLTPAGACAVTLPLASAKFGPVTIADTGGTGATRNITISSTAPETINGSGSYVISSNYGSVTLVPLTGIGYMSESAAAITANLANPGTTIGLSAVNGVSASALRADGAPALSQAIAPTWSALHIFSVAPRLPSSTIDNIVIGTGALPSPSGSGTKNVAIGTSALAATTTGNITVAIGYQAGQSITTARAGVYVGNVAGQNVTTGESNTFVGGFAGQGVVATPLTGANNTCVGEAACIWISGAANSNSAVGFNALYGMGAGVSNTAIGNGAGKILVTGGGNSLLGTVAYTYGLGSNNTILGFGAGFGSTAVSAALASDAAAGATTLLFSNTSAFLVNDTIFSGSTTPNAVVTAIDPNVSITISPALAASMSGGATFTIIRSPHTGSGIIAIGLNALAKLQGSVADSIAIGTNTLSESTTGSNNVAVGGSALSNLTTGATNAAFGRLSLQRLTTGSNNTGLGYAAMQGSAGTPPTGSSNTAIGASALSLMEGATANNTALGKSAGGAITTGGTNTLVGASTGAAITTGTGNTIIGQGAAATLATGSNNIIIGASVDVAASSTANTINIREIIKSTGTGTASTSLTTAAGVWSHPDGAVQGRSGTATPAAAAGVAGFTLGSALVGIYWGTGSPSTALTAPQGSIYIRTDGSSSSTRMYINTDGSTAWTNVTTAG